MYKLNGVMYSQRKLNQKLKNCKTNWKDYAGEELLVLKF